MKLDAYFAGCVAAGLLLRLADIGAHPLGGEEAVGAFAAWTSVSGGQAGLLATVPDSALLHGLQASVFWLAGSGDAAARLPVALVSMLPVLLVWSAAAGVGRVEAMTLAALLAFDPISIGYGRLADSAALSLAAAWGVVICAAGASSPALSSGHRAVWAHGVWISAGICLASGQLAWDLLFPLSLLLGVLSQAGMTPIARPAAIVGLSALIAGSAALTRWDGPQFVSSGATYWLRSFSEDAGGLPALWTGVTRLEILPMALGLAGITHRLLACRRGPSSKEHPLFSARVFIALSLWLLWGLLVTLRPGRSLTVWLMVQPPVFLGACYLTARMIAAVRHSAPRRPRAVRLASAAGVLALLAFAGAGVKVAAGDRAGWFRPHPTVAEPGVRHLAHDVQSLRASGDAGLDIVAPGGEDPLLGWYLRDAPDVRWVTAPPRPASAIRYVVIPSATAAAAPGDVAVYPVRRRADSLEWMRLQQFGGGS